MYRSISYIAGFCVSVALMQACARPRSSNVAPAAQPAASPDKPRPAEDSFAIKGILANADGSPAAGKIVSAHPLDKKGTPLFVSIFEVTQGGGATPKPWNPKAETDGNGRFGLTMPRISRLGDDPLKEVALAADAKPEGGWVVGTISRIYYTDKAKKEDMCFLKEDKNIKLLRSGNDVLKIRVDENTSDVDVGKPGSRIPSWVWKRLA